MTEVWSKADLHIHSNHSDGLAKIPEIMEYVAHRTDLAAIAITDHNTLEGALFARPCRICTTSRSLSARRSRPSPGISSGLWLQEAIPPNLSAAETVSRINEQDGVAIIAHPFANRAFGPFGLESVGQAIYDVAFHALEVYNSSPYLIYANRLAAKAFAGGQGIAATGGSDAHVLRAIGNGYTVYRGTTAGDLRASIDNLETRAEASKGGLSVALRYAFRYPQIRRLQSWNWERCKATK